MIWVALDAMGGDYAPTEIVCGAYNALTDAMVGIVLVGIEDQIRQEMQKYTHWPQDRIKVVHAPEVVGMSESPSSSFRKKKQSSIRVGLDLVKAGDAQAFVSAGNTGAVMAASLLIFGKNDLIERPAIATVFPSEHGPAVVLDMGSNVDCKPEYLVQFAIMGSCFAQSVLHIQNPRVGLLNIGEEEEKGNAATLEAYQRLKQGSLNFVGNVEGRDILAGSADVVVCDGFVGNAILKFGEGVVKVFFNFFKREAKTSLISLLGLLLLKPALKRLQKQYDYEEYGGAPLLGVNGVSIVAHGNSKAQAIKNAVRTAIQSVEGGVVEKIRGAFTI